MKLFVLISTLIVLFIPKIILIPIGDSGVRVEDVVVFFIFIAFISDCLSSQRASVNRFIALYVLFVVVYFISSVLNSIDGRVTYLQSFLFSARLLEYLVFYFLGVGLYKYRVDLSCIFKSYVLFLVIIYLLQHAGLLNSLNEFSINRFSGNTNGPYEMALIASFLFFYFAKYNNKFYASVSFLIVMATASRITIFITFAILVFLYFFTQRRVIKKNTLYILMFFCLILPLCLIFINFDLYILERLYGVFSEDTYNSLKNLYISSGSVTNQEEYKLAAYGNSMSSVLSMSGDGSSLIRFHRWIILVKSTFSTPLTTFFGLGPSFASVAVDGYYTRVLIETGIIGLTLFIIFLVYAYKSSRVKILKVIVLIMSATALFIDIFVALKPMFMFWALFGYYQSEQVMKIEIEETG